MKINSKTNQNTIKTKQKPYKQVHKQMHLAFLMMIVIVLALTPFGFLQIGPLKVTFIQIPVIIGSLLMGWRYGAILGGLFGLLSLINNTVAPGPLSFVFSPFIPVLGSSQGSLWALVVAFGPRILVGIIPDFVYKKTKKLSLSIILGSLTNTFLVVSLITFIFPIPMKKDINTLMGFLLTSILGNGLLEAISATLIVSRIYKHLYPKVKYN